MIDQQSSGTAASACTVVLRAPSAVFFKEGEQLTINEFPSSIGPVKIVYASRWVVVGETVRVPGQLWIHVEGSAGDLDTALPAFANAGISFLPLLSVGFNAAIHEGEVELGFESGVGNQKRKYFQQYLAPEASLPYAYRQAQPDVAVAMCQSVASHPERSRLLRACNQYRLALESWKQGRESLSTAHLWMAIEALTKVQIKASMLEAKAESQQALADLLEVPLEKLDPHIRREILFQRDEACYAAARKASDGFEHGFMDFDEMRRHGENVRHKLAAYVRSAIFRLAHVPSDMISRILKEPYATPLGLWPVAKYLRGILEGELTRLAPDGQAYPFINWNPTISAWALAQDGKVQLSLNNKFTSQLGDGTTFTPVSFEAWQQH